MADRDEAQNKSDRELLLDIYGDVRELNGKFVPVEKAVWRHEAIVQRGKGALWLVAGVGAAIGVVAALIEKVSAWWSR